MLLCLYSAAINRRSVSISVLAESAQVQRFAAVRWIAALEQEKLVTRQAGEGISLSKECCPAMDSYFENMSSGEI